MKSPLLSTLLLSGGFFYACDNDRCANTVTRTVWNVRTRKFTETFTKSIPYTTTSTKYVPGDVQKKTVTLFTSTKTHVVSTITKDGIITTTTLTMPGGYSTVTVPGAGEVTTVTIPGAGEMTTVYGFLWTEVRGNIGAPLLDGCRSTLNYEEQSVVVYYSPGVSTQQFIKQHLYPLVPHPTTSYPTKPHTQPPPPPAQTRKLAKRHNT
ncbi:hypothetical protein P167DRAFT_598315 [Morchella conica CCBAS932]|uniref:Uncharacterized protein n=1 Tax=Morchella conica CCBAS932 TaxID=1392247 RepID=A0A3N4KAL6_9PEZI|nr:hypothetical protein P167DRAFT_598315 [Morchella conica CCBAS932]